MITVRLMEELKKIFKIYATVICGVEVEVHWSHATFHYFNSISWIIKGIRYGHLKVRA